MSTESHREKSRFEKRERSSQELDKLEERKVLEKRVYPSVWFVVFLVATREAQLCVSRKEHATVTFNKLHHHHHHHHLYSMERKKDAT